jgi:hypothetical protein
MLFVMNVTFMSIFDDERHHHHFPTAGMGASWRLRQGRWCS